MSSSDDRLGDCHEVAFPDIVPELTEPARGTSSAGFCAAGFEGVRAAFERNFSERGELGASVRVRAGGVPVVDLWGGVADPDTGGLWERDRVSVIFSATKGAAATCVHLLAARGELDLERPVADYWPEFARKGKDRVTIHDVLAHRSGLPAIRAPLPEGAFFDPELMADLIAAEAPFFPPGQQHGYTGMTFGYILDALIRRADGRSLGRYFAEELAGPFGLDFWIGAPPQVEPRIAPMLLPEIDPVTAPEFFLLPADPQSVPGLRITNARSLAGLYEPLVFPGVDHHGVCFDSEAVAWMSSVHFVGYDQTLRVNIRYGLGYLLALDNRWRPPRQRDSLLIGPDAFGHSGFGGTIGFADPRHGVAFG